MLCVCRSDEWKKVPAKEKEKMNIKIDDDGDFWSVSVTLRNVGNLQ